jgi:hypothetical protein
MISFVLSYVTSFLFAWGYQNGLMFGIGAEGCTPSVGALFELDLL